ncbi:Protein translocase subunit [Frankliniella fusca]|uniref:Protein translocase subunit n=1 Tax=Frankliniella fusca TaxID=407009 RepID=A0AAE1HCE2_9NEOP|nr:Protein translocase subunit [Frankliniella fusca]KAK3918462.1 Protein translocase subunit [Frankliniella fusca]
MPGFANKRVKSHIAPSSDAESDCKLSTYRAKVSARASCPTARHTYGITVETHCKPRIAAPLPYTHTPVWPSWRETRLTSLQRVGNSNYLEKAASCGCAHVGKHCERRERRVGSRSAGSARRRGKTGAGELGALRGRSKPANKYYSSSLIAEVNLGPY